MKRQMWKYDVEPGEFVVEMPKNAEVLSVAMQLGEPKMWASVDPTEPMRERRFVVVGTGHDVEGALLFIGTFFPEPWLVFHLFERQGGVNPRYGEGRTMDERCWYAGCDAPVCEADKESRSETAKFCNKHSEEADAALDSPEATMRFFVRSQAWKG